MRQVFDCGPRKPVILLVLAIWQSNKQTGCGKFVTMSCPAWVVMLLLRRTVFSLNPFWGNIQSRCQSSYEAAAGIASVSPTIRELGARLKYNQTYCRRGPLYTVRPGAGVHRGRFWTSASNAFALNSGKLSLSRKNWCLTTSVRATVTCAE